LGEWAAQSMPPRRAQAGTPVRSNGVWRFGGHGGSLPCYHGNIEHMFYIAMVADRITEGKGFGGQLFTG
jgi:hypothetical protein